MAKNMGSILKSSLKKIIWDKLLHWKGKNKNQFLALASDPLSWNIWQSKIALPERSPDSLWNLFKWVFDTRHDLGYLCFPFLNFILLFQRWMVIASHSFFKSWKQIILQNHYYHLGPHRFSMAYVYLNIFYFHFTIKDILSPFVFEFCRLWQRC